MDLWRKLSSRKFWLAVATFIVAIFIYLNVDIDTQKTQALIMAAGAVIAYIVSEGFADGMHAKNDTEDEEVYETTSNDEPKDGEKTGFEDDQEETEEEET